eukprot:765335-Hanusia_phi.AAC.6
MVLYEPVPAGADASDAFFELANSRVEGRSLKWSCIRGRTHFDGRSVQYKCASGRKIDIEQERDIKNCIFNDLALECNILVYVLVKRRGLDRLGWDQEDEYLDQPTQSIEGTKKRGKTEGQEGRICEFVWCDLSDWNRAGSEQEAKNKKVLWKVKDQTDNCGYECSRRLLVTCVEGLGSGGRLWTAGLDSG